MFVFVQLYESKMFAVGPLTISVSDTGPKLVTKMFVLISVTFSVQRERETERELERRERDDES